MAQLHHNQAINSNDDGTTNAFFGSGNIVVDPALEPYVSSYTSSYTSSSQSGGSFEPLAKRVRTASSAAPTGRSLASNEHGLTPRSSSSAGGSSTTDGRFSTPTSSESAYGASATDKPADVASATNKPADNASTPPHGSQPTTVIPPFQPISGGAASLLKRTYNKALGKTSNGRRLTGENDPENIEILRLRQVENMDFENIAVTMNKKRAMNGLAPNLTPNAVYSRYKRNGPLIAAANGQEFMPTVKDKKAGGSCIPFKKVLPIIGWNAVEDELLCKAYREVTEKFWTQVSDHVVELGGKEHTAEMCALRFGKL